jgi:hypothetical protein
MFIFGSLIWDEDDSGESFIGENLSIYQAQWLRTQGEALGQTRTAILEAVIKEWLADRSPDDWANLKAAEIARRALGEFVLRHHAEFLPIVPSAL